MLLTRPRLLAAWLLIRAADLLCWLARRIVPEMSDDDEMAVEPAELIWSPPK